MVEAKPDPALELLAGSNANLRALLDASSRVSIIATDVDGTIRIFNEGARQLLGYEPEEVVGTQTPEIIHLREEVEARGRELSQEFGRPVEGFEVFVAYAKQGRYEEREWTYITKTGEHRWVNLAVTAVRNDEGEIIGFLGTAVDTTERKRVEERLRASERLFRSLFEDSADALLLLEDDHFVDCNDGTVRMLRARNKADVLNTSPWDLSPEFQMDGRSSRDKVLEMIQKAHTEGSHRFEWLHRRADGDVFPVEVLLTKITLDNRTMLHTCWRDISDRKRAEEQLRQSQKMEVVGQLAGGVAHDFNNMLAAIVGGTEMLAMEVVDRPEAMESVELIAAAASRAADLTSKLLTFARKGAEAVALVDIHEVIASAAQIMARTLDKRISIRQCTEASLSTVMGDATELENALMNLGVNARDAMVGAGSLTISTENVELGPEETVMGAFTLPAGLYVCISVEDTGRGIPPELRSRIFEPFFTTKGVGEGTGLGLASVFGTVKSHRGGIMVRSEVDTGSRFDIYLPVVQGQAQSKDRGAEPGGISGGGTILIVDDEPLVRRMLARMLGSAGFEVILAEGVLEAESVFADRCEEIDAVVLDMIMPGLTGRDGFERLRAIDPQAKIFLLSGYLHGEEVNGLLARGLSGFVRKPVPRGELVRLLREVIDGSGREAR